MSYSDVADKIEMVISRLDSVKAIIELVAESITEDNISGSLWGCSELLSVYSQKLQDLAAECQEIESD